MIYLYFSFDLNVIGLWLRGDMMTHLQRRVVEVKVRVTTTEWSSDDKVSSAIFFSVYACVIRAPLKAGTL